MYLLQASIEDRVPKSVTQSEINTGTLRFHLLSDVYIALSWTMLFAVKFSFMFFFRMLISRFRAMELYWRCLIGVMTFTWLVGSGNHPFCTVSAEK